MPLLVEYRELNRTDMGLYEVKWVRRNKPVDKRYPLPYLMYGAQVKPGRNGDAAKALSDLTHRGYGLSNPTILAAYTKAHDDFIEKVKSLTISGGENLGESRKTLAMMADKAEKARDLTKVTFQRNRKKKRWTSYVKGPAKWWLEYHLAIRPIMADLYNGAVMLSEPTWEVTPVRSSGRETLTIDRSHPRDWRFAEVDVSKIDARVRLQGLVYITNPNAFLLNRVGLINPLQVAWQLTPLSMFVDWWWNVSSFLGSYTDQVGWSLKNGQMGMHDTCVNTYVIENPYAAPESNVRPSRAWRFQRELISSLPIPPLSTRGGSGIKSITRGTTAIAVLVGFLR